MTRWRIIDLQIDIDQCHCIFSKLFSKIFNSNHIPFPPEILPFINCFCETKKNTSTGSI